MFVAQFCKASKDFIARHGNIRLLSIDCVIVIFLKMESLGFISFSLKLVHEKTNHILMKKTSPRKS